MSPSPQIKNSEGEHSVNNLNGIDNEVPVRKLPHFHGAVSAAREQSVVLVNEDLRDSLADVLEDSMPGVLLRECVVALVTV